MKSNYSMATYNIDELGSSEINTRTNITSTRFSSKYTSENKRDSYTMRFFFLGTIEPVERILHPVRILQVNNYQRCSNIILDKDIIGCLLNNLTTYQTWVGYLMSKFFKQKRTLGAIYT